MKKIGFILALALSACAHAQEAKPPIISTPPAAVAEQKIYRFDSEPRIAVATAYEPEFEALVGHLQNKKTYSDHGVSFHTGELAGKKVILFMTGVSMVNAAMNTQFLFDSFNVTDLLMSGIAGGVDPAFKIGDVAIPERWGQYNETIYLRIKNGKLVLPLYQDKLEFPPFMFIAPVGVRIATAANPNPDRQFWFDADPAMIEAAKIAAAKAKFKTCTPQGNCLSHQPKAVVGGNGVTGSAFMDNAKFRQYLFKTFDARVVEMETAAVAMAAHSNGVRFIAFRSLSDLAGGGAATHNEEETFFALASENAASFTLAFLEVYQPPVPAK
jgi:adenosylhomocysteine nucleosidase